MIDRVSWKFGIGLAMLMLLTASHAHATPGCTNSSEEGSATISNTGVSGQTYDYTLMLSGDTDSCVDFLDGITIVMGSGATPDLQVYSTTTPTGVAGTALSGAGVTSTYVTLTGSGPDLYEVQYYNDSSVTLEDGTAYTFTLTTTGSAPGTVAYDVLGEVDPTTGGPNAPTAAAEPGTLGLLLAGVLGLGLLLGRNRYRDNRLAARA